MSECKNAIRVFAITNTEWTEIVAPRNCSYFDIIGTLDGSAMQRSSDPSNPQAWYTIPANGWYSMIAAVHGINDNRFCGGETVTWLKATVASTSVVVEFVQ